MSNENVQNNTNEDAPLVERQWPCVVALKHPIEWGSKTVAELTFQRGRMGYLKGIKPDGIPSFDQLIQIASRMCGEPTALFDRLDVDDAGEVMAIALDFFVRCLRIGKSPSPF